MAGQQAWTKGDLQSILDAEKSAHGFAATWSPALLPSGAVMSATLKFAVTGAGHDLLVQAEWKGPEDQQIMLRFPRRNGNIARLCLTRCHPAQPHWHFFDQFKDIAEETEAIAGAPAGPQAMDTLLRLFIARQRIVNLVLSAPLFHGP